jgi:hypothetical protein
MTAESKSIAGTKERLPWLVIGKLLLLAAFIVALFLLGASMAHHRFFWGDRVDQRGVVTQ